MSNKREVDGAARFHQMIKARLPSANARVLDIGAGPQGAPWSSRPVPTACRLVGIDIDPRIAENRFLDEAYIASCEALPFPDTSFDIVYSDFVFEHLADPGITIREIGRVLRPGGFFLLRTPNKWHYVTIASRLLPNVLHTAVLNVLTPHRDREDVYRTYYRCNSERDVIRAFTREGFEVNEIRMWEGEPSYFLNWKHSLYWLGVAYGRVVTSAGWLRGLRCNILAAFRWPPGFHASQP